MFKELTPQKQNLVHEAISKLKVFFYEARQMSQGLGLKSLRGIYWEIRVALRDRILFSLQKNVVSFILVGNHDDMRRYLKNI